MKAIIKPDRAPGLVLADVPEPEIGPTDVLIRVHRAGICGTDLHIHDWDWWSQKRIQPPLVLGHEFMGMVEEVGDLVDNVGVGDRVSAESHVVCGHCSLCRTGNGHVCRNTSIIGVDRDGAFAELVSVPATNLIPLPDSIVDDHAAVFDPLGNAFHTVLRNDVTARNVVIIGCGPIGLFAVGIARAAAAAKVIAIEPRPQRLELAKAMGAHLVLQPGTDSVEMEVLAATEGYGAEVVCEMSGHPDGIRTAFRVARNGGNVQLLGLPKDEVSIDLARDVIFKGLQVYGVVGRRLFETWHQMRDFLDAGLLDIEPVITHRVSLEDFQDALEAMADGSAAKVVLTVA
jgi:threonine 3-dehydrogenase